MFDRFAYKFHCMEEGFVVKQITEAEFEVDLGKMHGAIGSLKSDSAAIKGLLAQIGTKFSSAQSAWQSPSGATFAQTQAWFKRSAQDLQDLLDEASRRLNSAYQNYVATEHTNTGNMGG
jgi:WXG100 family type VII secretion target